MELTRNSDYAGLLERISGTFNHGQTQAAQAVNSVLVDTYWQVGRQIVEFEQVGQQRAAYGKALLEALANDLTLRHGRGFSRSNLNHMRLFYLRYPICEKVSHKLSWSHYVDLLKLDDALERSFYEQQAITERWSVPELRRQKSTSLFLRLAASKDKAGILQLAKQGQIYRLFQYSYTKIEFVAEDLLITRQTASKYLDQVSKLGIISKHKLGKEHYFLNIALYTCLYGAGERMQLGQTDV